MLMSTRITCHAKHYATGTWWVHGPGTMFGFKGQSMFFNFMVSGGSIETC